MISIPSSPSSALDSDSQVRDGVSLSSAATAIAALVPRPRRLVLGLEAARGWRLRGLRSSLRTWSRLLLVLTALTNSTTPIPRICMFWSDKCRSRPSAQESRSALPSATMPLYDTAYPLSVISLDVIWCLILLMGCVI
eukprot:3288748-Rhodomonas_salina.2